MIIMTDIKKLLNKYDARVPYEERSHETDKYRKRNERKIKLHKTCEDLFNECECYKKLKLNYYQKKRVKFLVDKFGGNFKRLHGTAKKETIILAFIFYIKKSEDPTLRLNDYAITSEYKLTNDVFVIIVCRVLSEYMMNAPIVPYGSTNYDHEILSKNGGKI